MNKPAARQRPRRNEGRTCAVSISVPFCQTTSVGQARQTSYQASAAMTAEATTIHAINVRARTLPAPWIAIGGTNRARHRNGANSPGSVAGQALAS